MDDLMKWMGEHLRLVLTVAGFGIYWIFQSLRKKADENREPEQSRGLRENESDMDAGENTRRIQEEIRRKIAERRGGVEQADTPYEHRERPVPVLPAQTVRGPSTPPPLQRKNVLSPKVRAMRREEDEEAAAASLERQRGLAEQLAALQARRAEAGRDAKAVWSTGPELSGVDAIGASSTSVEGGRAGELGLLRELRNARSLRKAIVLREVLDKPVALR